jgi:hypothetical protein
MTSAHRDEWSNEAARLWRVARSNTWTRLPMSVRLGWRSPDAKSKQRLAEHLSALGTVQLSSAEAYEPECDPDEIIVQAQARKLSQAEFEAQVQWGLEIAGDFGVELSRLGLNPDVPAA